jgi:hypothetical protein
VCFEDLAIPPCTTWTICSGRSIGSSVKSNALTAPRIVVLPRMPIASVRTATMAKPGARVSVRTAYSRSCHNVKKSVKRR